MKTNAKWVTCGSNESEHSYNDNCWGCAPFWWNIPVCPTHNEKLNVSGFCKECKKFYNLKEKSNA